MKKIILLAVLLMICIIPISTYAQEDNYLDVKIGNSYSNNETVSISSEENISLMDSNLKEIQSLNSKEILVTLKNGKIELRNKDQIISSDFPQNGNLLMGTSGYFKINNVYRGFISFRVVDNKLLIINHVNMEDYLKGVVPKELSYTYPKEALKAQAVCSRCFAIKNINKYEKYGYNLDDTTNSQVYGGKTVENERSNAAVDETKGVIAMFNNEVANTIFGASSGGKTANAAEVWAGEPIFYLCSREDPYSRDYTWQYSLEKNKIRDILLKNKIDIGEFLNFNVAEQDVSGRNKTIEIIGTKKTEKITGNKFRSIFGNTNLKSTLFDIANSKEIITFNGRGYGHGVGMSQYGAVEMAKQGKNYTDIITFYFPGVTLNNK